MDNIILSNTLSYWVSKFDISNLDKILDVSNEVITHKEGKGITKTYDLNATSTLDEVSISNYRVVHKKIIQENGGWRVMTLLSLKVS